MATAKITRSKIEVTLVLTAAEAVDLHEVLGSLCGEDGRRTLSVYTALFCALD